MIIQDLLQTDDIGNLLLNNMANEFVPDICLAQTLAQTAANGSSLDDDSLVEVPVVSLTLRNSYAEPFLDFL